MKNPALPRFLSCLLLVSACASARAGDWPAYRGPNHDGASPERVMVAPWTGGGPRQIWKAPTPTGFSSFAVGGGKAFTLVQRSIEGVNLEVCVAVDAQTGKELWAQKFGFAQYDKGGDSGGGGDGPRSTPTVDGKSVYVYDGHMILACLDADTGKIVWSKDILKEHQGQPIHWQNASSPLIDGELVFVAGGGPGQALLGINKRNGAVVWKGQDDKATHSTPIATTILGTRQVVFFTQTGLVSVAPQNGQVLWRYPFKYSTSTAISPVVYNDIVYCSAGYGVGGGACRIAKSGFSFTATEIWRKPNQSVNHWSTPVVKDGYLYGMFSFKEYGKGPMKCVEIATGNEVWAQPGFGPGNCILVGNQLVTLTDQGQLVLVDANPKAYAERARAQVVGGKCWSTPAFSNGRIYVRSTTEGACLEVAARTAAR
jgi:outer membrane protein assembly factor BamB